MQATRRLPGKYVTIQSNIETQDKKVKFVMYLFADGPREYDTLLRILSLGRDRYWRRSILEEAEPGPRTMMLDLACGTGLVSFDLASKGSAVVGVDVTREMLLRANDLKKSYEKTLGDKIDVDFIHARAERLPFRNDVFDCSTISLAMRNVSSIEGTISEMKRCVRPEGYVMSLDFTLPSGKLFRHFYSFYIFRVLPAFGLAVSRHWYGIFTYLANSIRRSRSPEQIREILQDQGLEMISVKRMTRGVTALVTGKKAIAKHWDSIEC